MDFLPDDYQVPSKADGYMKLQQGDNRFRIMSQPIIGWEWWTREDGTIKQKNDAPRPGDKPRRVRQEGPVPSEAGETAKHFWAVVVWNYEVKQFQIFQINQKGIQKTIRGLSRDEDWGNPTGYDIVITKTGEKMETEYEVKPKPVKPLDAEIAEQYKKLNINLEALYDGGDPFGAGAEPESEYEEVDVEELPSELYAT